MVLQALADLAEDIAADEEAEPVEPAAAAAAAAVPVAGAAEPVQAPPAALPAVVPEGSVQLPPHVRYGGPQQLHEWQHGQQQQQQPGSRWPPSEAAAALTADEIAELRQAVQHTPSPTPGTDAAAVVAPSQVVSIAPEAQLTWGKGLARYGLAM